MYIGELAQLILQYHNFFEHTTENSLTRFFSGSSHKMKMFVVLHIDIDGKI